MKRLVKAWKSKEALLVLIFILISLGIRFYNFPNRVTYGPEQARSLIVSARNITEKPSFLGQEYFRVTSKGHKLFYSSLFTFSLVPLLVLFRYDPILITAYFAVLNVVVGIVTYLVVAKISNKTIAFLTLVLFLFNSSVVYHSFFLWPYHYLPLFGILSLYLLFRHKDKNEAPTSLRPGYLLPDLRRERNSSEAKNSPLSSSNLRTRFMTKGDKLLHTLLLGLISGVGFGIQYLYAVFIIPIVSFLVYFSTKRIKSLLAFTTGFVLGVFPMIVFDLRHDFYYFNTVSQYLIDTLQGKSDASLNYYYFLPLWPIIAFSVGLLLYRLYRKSKVVVVILMVLYFSINMRSPLINYSEPTGMAPGLTWKKVLRASEIIAEDKPDDFNVVTLLDFDTRGYILRYPIEIIHGFKPKGDEEYPQSKTVYVLSKNDYDFADPQVWELQVIMPYDVQNVSEIDSSYGVYKLVKR